VDQRRRVRAHQVHGDAAVDAHHDDRLCAGDDDEEDEEGDVVVGL
jgi:hypothetical protein